MKCFHCERCGDCDTALLNGYRFGDVPLEGVWFLVRISPIGEVADFQPTEDSKPFFQNMELKKYHEILALGKETSQDMVDNDMFTCQYCKDDAVVIEV